MERIFVHGDPLAVLMLRESLYVNGARLTIDEEAVRVWETDGTRFTSVRAYGESVEVTALPEGDTTAFDFPTTKRGEPDWQQAAKRIIAISDRTGSAETT